MLPLGLALLLWASQVDVTTGHRILRLLLLHGFWCCLIVRSGTPLPLQLAFLLCARLLWVFPVVRACTLIGADTTPSIIKCSWCCCVLLLFYYVVGIRFLDRIRLARYGAEPRHWERIANLVAGGSIVLPVSILLVIWLACNAHINLLVRKKWLCCLENFPRVCSFQI